MTRLQEIYTWFLWRAGNVGVYVNGAELSPAFIPAAKEIHKRRKPDPQEIQALMLGLVLEKATFTVKDEAARLRFNRSRDFKGLTLGES